MNGETHLGTTTFALADADEVELVSFLTELRDGVRQPPVERLDTEKAILRAEAANRGSGPVSRLRTWRYGPAGFGLAGFDEIGRARSSLPGTPIMPSSPPSLTHCPSIMSSSAEPWWTCWST